MENRRLTRASADVVPVPRKVTTRKSPSRKTTARQKSLSPVISKSPARGKSKSPARERRTTKDAAKTKIKHVVASETYDFDYQPPRNEKVTEKKRGRPRLTDKQIGDIQKSSPKILLNKLNVSMKEEKITISKSSPKSLDDSGDNEVANIIASKRLSILREGSKTFTPDPSLHSNLTPTTTEQSRRTTSRSVSLFDESQEYSDQEYESFTRGENNGLEHDDEPNNYTRRSVVKQQLELQEFGGRLGAILLIFLIPVFTFAINYLCNAETCDFRKVNIDKLKELNTYFNMEIGVVFLLFTWGITIASSLPLGKIVQFQNERGGYTEYYFTGLSCSILTLIAIFVAEYCYKYPLINLILNNYIQLVCVSIVYGMIISTCCFIRSRFIQPYLLNPYAKTYRFPIDLFIGREINPKWFQLIDIKLVHYHISIALALVINSIFFYRNLTIPVVIEGEQLSDKILYLIQNVKFNNITLLTSSLLIIYLLDVLLFEHHLTWSFELQSEGVGAQLLTRYSTFPFIVSLISKYSFEHPITDAPLWIIGIVSFLFLLGLFIKRSSNKLKYAYRMNPLTPEFLSE